MQALTLMIVYALTTFAVQFIGFSDQPARRL